jgi:hypothetical protein
MKTDIIDARLDRKADEPGAARAAGWARHADR